MIKMDEIDILHKIPLLTLLPIKSFSVQWFYRKSVDGYLKHFNIKSKIKNYFGSIITNLKFDFKILKTFSAKAH